MNCLKRIYNKSENLNLLLKILLTEEENLDKNQSRLIDKLEEHFSLSPTDNIDSLIDEVCDILNENNDFKNTLKEAIKSRNEVDTEEQELLTEVDKKIKKESGLDKFLLEYFEDNELYIEIRNNNFRRQIIELITIDTLGEGKEMAERVCSSVKDINSGIANFKSTLFLIIRKFLESLGEYNNDLLARSYYIDSKKGIENNLMLLTLDTFYLYLKDYKLSGLLLSKIENEWNKKILQQKGTDFLDALDAYINIVYLDSLINKYYNGLLKVNKKLIEPISIKSEFDSSLVYKYSLVNENVNAAKSWNDLEKLRNAIDETSPMILSIIEGIPLISYIDREPLYGYVSVSSFGVSFCELFQSVIEKNNSELIDLIDLYYENPKENLYNIFKAIFNSADATRSRIKQLNLNPQAENVLYSVYSKLFLNDHSYYKIENAFELKEAKKPLFNITEILSSYIGSFTSMNYLLSKYDLKLGEFKTSVKEKINSDRDYFNYVNNLNSFIPGLPKDLLKQLVLKYLLYRADTENAKVFNIDFGNKKISLRRSSSVLTKYLLGDEYKYTVDLNGLKLESINNSLKTKELREKFIDGKGLNLELEFLKSIILFFDDTLKTGFLNSQEGLRDFFLLMRDEKELTALKEMLQTAFKIIVLANLYLYEVNDIKEAINYSNERKDELFSGNLPNELSKDDLWKDSFGNSYLKIININTSGNSWVNKLINLRVIMSGDVSLSVISNLEGDSIPNISPMFQGAKIRGRFKEFSKLMPKRTNDSGKEYVYELPFSKLLFSRELLHTKIKRVVIDTDIQYLDNVKAIKNMSESELIIHSIFDKFYSDKEEKTFILQPTTYSDKSKFINDELDAKLETNFNVLKAGEDEFISRILKTIGEFYTAVLKNVLNNYERLFGTRDILEINEYLKGYNKYDLIKLAYENNINLQEDVDYVQYGNILEINPILVYLLEVYNDETKLKKKLNQEKVEFVNRLLKTKIHFDTALEYSAILKLRTSGKSKRWFTLVNEHGLNYESKYMILAKYKDKNGKTINVISGEQIDLDKMVDFELNPLLNQYFLANALIGLNLRLGHSGSEIGHEDKTLKRRNVYNNLLSSYTGTLFKESNTFRTLLLSYIDSDINDISEVFVNDEGSTLVKFTNGTLQEIKNIFISPLLAQKIISELTTHKDFLSKKLDNLFRKIESNMLLSQLKRNVIVPGTITPYNNSTFRGIGKYYNVAVVDSTLANVFNYNGQGVKLDGKHIEAHDGTGWLCPVTSILENNCLPNKVGTLKKPLLDSYIKETGTSVLFKYAVNTFTNQFAMRTVESQIAADRMLRKFLDVQWEESDDILSLIDELDFDSDIAKNKELCYVKGNDKYKITGLSVVEINGKRTIKTTVRRFNNGTWGKLQISIEHWFDDNGIDHHDYLDNYHGVNSLYELHKVLGGIYSVELDNSMSGWHVSEMSNEALTEIVINAKKYIGKTDDEGNPIDDNGKVLEWNEVPLETKYYDLPLKYKMVDCILDKTAVKNGRINVNPNTSLYDNSKLMTMKVETSNYGIQQDSDHIADEAIMTEFSQVISSLDVGGRLHGKIKLIYRVLGMVALDEASIELEAYTDLIENGNINKLYELIGKTIIANFKAGKNEQGLAKEILNKAKKELNLNTDHENDIFKIPFSDPNVYSRILNDFIAIINNKSVKKKYPGNGMVMAAGYDMVLIFEINEQTMLYEDVLKEASLELVSKKQFITNDDIYEGNHQLVTEWLNNKQLEQELITVDQINPTDKVFVTIVGLPETINGKLSDNTTLIINLNEIKDYYEFKNNPLVYLSLKLEGIDLKLYEIKYQKCVILPRNLRPLMIYWTMKDATGNIKHMNIYDIPKVSQFYKTGMKIPTSLIQNEFDNLKNNKKYIDENGIEYDVFDLKNEEAECIVSNINLTKYGLNSYESLYSIIKNGRARFKLNSKIISNNNIFNIAFGKPNGENVYISFTNIEELKDSDRKKYTKLSWNNIRREPAKEDSSFVFRVYALNNENQKLFEIGREIDVSDKIKVDKGIFKDFSGKIVDGSYRVDNGRVLQYIEFLSKYRVRFQGKASITNVELYNISSSKYELVKDNIPTDEIKATMKEKSIKKKDAINLLSANRRYNFYSDLLSQIYKSDDFCGIEFNKELTAGSLNFLTNIIGNLSSKLPHDELLTNYLKDVYNLFKTTRFNENLSRINIEKINEGKYKEIKNNYYTKLADEKFTSFEEALYFISSRIPALTTLSFMKMKAVAFTGLAKNECYVSHWLTFLQGSDYDIDKAYMMGFSIANNGTFAKWTNLFDLYSPKTAKQSEQFEVFDNFIIKNDGTNSEEVNSLLLNILIAESKLNSNEEKINEEQLRLNRLISYLNLLNYLKENNIEELVIQNNSNLDKVGIKRKLIEHTKFLRDLPRNLKQKALRNYITSNIGNAVLDLTNSVNAYIPIEIEILRNASLNFDKWASKIINDETDIATMTNPFTIYRMLYENMVGKKVVGIAANGEKASFIAHYYTREMIEKGNAEFEKNPESLTNLWYELTKMSFTVKRLKNRRNIKPNEIDEFTVTCLPDIDTSKVKSLQVRNYLEGDGKTNGLLKPSIPPDLMISQILSAATDNAKELILANINAGDQFAKCYLFLIALGFEIEDIVSFMTSPAINHMASICLDNIYYNDANNISILIDRAIRIARYKNDPTTEEKFSIGLFEDIDTSIFGSEYSLNDFISDLEEFKHILAGADEFTSLARMLSINLGLPIDSIELNLFLDFIKNVKITAEKLAGIIDSNLLIKKSLSKQDFVITYSDIIGDEFDIEKFLDDKEYRKRTIDYYESKLKLAFNPFAIISGVPHFASLYKLLGMEIKVNSSLSVRSKLNESVSKLLRKDGVRVDEKLFNTINSYTNGLLVLNFMRTRNFKFRVPKGFSTINEYDKIYKLDSAQDLDLSKNLGMKQFKYIFEKYVIPNLKEGKIYWANNLNQSEKNKLRKELKENKFIQDLIEVEDEGIPKYRLTVDVGKKNKTANDIISKQNYLNGLNLLFGEEYRIGDYTLGEWFFIYNLIVNKNKYGRDKLTKIFEEILNSRDLSVINEWYKWLSNLDYKSTKINDILGELKFSKKDFLIFSAKPVHSTRGHNEPMLLLLGDETNDSSYWERISYGRYRQTNISTILDIKGESVYDRRNRLKLLKLYSIAGNTYEDYTSTIINKLNDIKDNIDIFTYLFNDMMKDTYLLLTKEC